MSLGLGKSLMAARYLLDGLTESAVTSKPRNSTSILPNWVFFLLNTMPALEQRERNLQTRLKFSSRVSL